MYIGLYITIIIGFVLIYKGYEKKKDTEVEMRKIELEEKRYNAAHTQTEEKKDESEEE